MAGQSNLSTITTITENLDGTESIEVAYSGSVLDELPNTIAAFVGGSTGVLGTVAYVEGELIILVKNYPDQISYLIDDSGNLVLYDTTGDTIQYYIDPVSGDLMYGQITPPPTTSAFTYTLPFTLT